MPGSGDSKGRGPGEGDRGVTAHSHALEKLHVLLVPPAALHLAVQPAQDLVLKLQGEDEEGLSREPQGRRGSPLPAVPGGPGAAPALTRLKLPVSRCSHSIMSKKMGMVDLRSSSSGTSVISRMGPTMPGMNSILRWPGRTGRAGGRIHTQARSQARTNNAPLPTAALGTVLMDTSPRRPQNPPSVPAVAHRGCTTCLGWTLRSWLSCPRTCRDRGQSAQPSCLIPKSPISWHGDSPGPGGDSLGQDPVALGRGEVLQLQGVLGEESHGQVEIVVPKLQWKKRGDECQARDRDGSSPDPPGPKQDWGSAHPLAARSRCRSGTSRSRSWQSG